MMPLGPIAEPESWVEQSSPPSQVQKTQSTSSWGRRGRMGTECEGLEMQNLEANTELRHSAFSQAEIAVVTFEVRKGMEGEHPPDTDVTRHHQLLEEGDKFETVNFEILTVILIFTKT